ncbi:FecR family protein [Chitinophaga sp. YR573]|uniref:FecR family protein n=1 Tax=Chitinophaga sp. YR573 TaxID=1881040 RepID=UPI0008CE80E2|nr:FecR family protein [Chitinophaga sp. YR573]SEW28597.1 FecR family protein [Chitinophaga sp. YR573]
MEDIQHLIEKFWAGKITPAEKQQLFEYMNNDAAWKEYMEQAYADSREELLSEPAGERVLQGLREQITVPKKVSIIPVWSRWAAAAMIIIMAGWGFFYINKDTHQLAIQTAPVKQLLQHSNTGRHTEIIALSDGSEVQLQPGSVISYYPSFDSLERNISLEGTALFKVAKDHQRPFSVIAKGFTTTALGTVFSVSTTQSDKLSVKLLEGKVVVKTARGSDLVMKEMYLTPGQEFVVNMVLKQFHVENIAPSKTVQAREHIIIMSFNKSHLQDVFAQLGNYYHVQFDIDTVAIKGLSFTGTFEKSDSLQVVLSAICNMNDLTFNKEGRKIVISKQQ